VQIYGKKSLFVLLTQFVDDLILFEIQHDPIDTGYFCGMDRRSFLTLSAASLIALRTRPTVAASSAGVRSVAITIDDPNTSEQPLVSWQERAERILSTLKTNNLNVALFVCGKRVDSEAGKALIKRWDEAGHMICNHSYSHLYFNAPKLPFEIYANDFRKGEDIIKSYPNFTKLYRYPYLKEGDTSEKRDAMRLLLASSGYRNGYVTIDASDWYIDDRLKAKLKLDPKADTTPYRDYFLSHILNRAEYYDGLSMDVLGRSIPHTLLLHHTLLNALYLGDLITEFHRKGWKVIGASDAFQDPVFQRKPQTLPAGESLLWALAKETGRYEGKLRYPGEDDTYEKDAMDKLSL
jgi:peptidoglycan/xylan/chitin deacetylase (PgdA/CDA1 family)